jgi:hypothetical protein
MSDMLFSTGSCSFNAESYVINISLFIIFITNTFSVFLIKLFYVVALCHAQPAIYYLLCHIQSLMKRSAEWNTEPSSTGVV